MNERIKELAEQIIGFEAKSSSLTFSPFELERFAELVRQDLYQEIGKSVITQIQTATKMEREACAKLVEEVGRQTATAIRGKTE